MLKVVKVLHSACIFTRERNHLKKTQLKPSPILEECNGNFKSGQTFFIMTIKCFKETCTYIWHIDVLNFLTDSTLHNILSEIRNKIQVENTSLARKQFLRPTSTLRRKYMKINASDCSPYKTLNMLRMIEVTRCRKH